MQEGVDPSLQLESDLQVDPTLQLTPDPPAWPGDQGWQAPEPQPVNTGLSGGKGESSSREVAAKLENALLAATIGVTIFFALVLVVILAKLYQTFESPLAPSASTVESQLSYLTSSAVGTSSGQQQQQQHQERGRKQTSRLVEGHGEQVLEGGGITSMTIEGTSPILEEGHSVSGIAVEEDEDGGVETKY